MAKNNNSKYLKSVLLVLSTLIFPLQIFSVVLYFVPALYTCIIVPYFIWKIWFGKEAQKIKIYSLFWSSRYTFCCIYHMLRRDVIIVCDLCNRNAVGWKNYNICLFAVFIALSGICNDDFRMATRYFEII